ncbi:MAG: flagellar hook-basal body complex protein, partial [Mesobacillus sp.]|uniref:flagellar hook-basal body complex protein n=1 Tax=Mesobacillus sp. TaxID=2675271 RepID=UPI003C570CE5
GDTEQLQQIKVVDSKGEEHTIELSVKSTGTSGEWEVTLQDRAKSSLTDMVITIKDGAVSQQAGTLSVDNGTTNGEQIPLTISLGNVTSKAGNLNALFAPNGTTQGAIESFSIGQTGEISGVFSNGRVETLGVLALGKFSNAAGLSKVGNNMFQDSVNSGTANIGTPGDGYGTIASGALEMSNVDLSEEFTEMITAQRGFQANTRIITTSDEILQELINLKR